MCKYIQEAKLILAETLINNGIDYDTETGILKPYCSGVYQFGFAGYGSTDLRLTLQCKRYDSDSWTTIVSTGPGGGSHLVLLDVVANDEYAIFVESGEITPDRVSFTARCVYRGY